MTAMEETFTGIVRDRAWWSEESASGVGSELEQTRHLRRELPLLLAELNISSLCDVPCGDFNWMQHVDLGSVRYVGGDIVRSLVADNSRRFGTVGREFKYLDVTTSDLPEVDAVLCRDCLVHLPLADIFGALRNICRSGARYLMTTTFSYRSLPANQDCNVGDWRRLNFELPPFHFPPPQRLLIEGTTEANGEYTDKSLGVWAVSQIRARVSESFG